MKPVVFRALLVALVAVALVGCMRSTLTVTDRPIDTPAGVNRTTDDVQKAIIRAGALQGWRMQVAKPGLIHATTSWGSHSATVEIPFNTTSYSILYKDSVNLYHDGTYVHRHYNNKVNELDRAIRAQLAVL